MVDTYKISRILDSMEYPEPYENIILESLHQNLTSVLNSGDFSPRNMGIWTHPHTGKKHVVLSDFGASNEILGLYDKARKNKYQRR